MTARIGWSASGLAYRYAGAEREAVADVGLEVGPGEVVAVLGPNGAGKSTLLGLLLGTRHPQRGSASFAGREVARWPRRELARRVAVLPQHETPAFPITVGQLVGMGRYPHLGAWRGPGAEDRAAVVDALERCGVRPMAGREFTSLSGGERQRARLARALAQRPQALALDEPTASLDVAHEMEIWELLAAEAASGRAVLLTTHNLNLAARYADRLMLLAAGRVAASGSPKEVVTADVIRAVYAWPVRVEPHAGPGPDAGAPQVVPLRAPPAGGRWPG